MTDDSEPKHDPNNPIVELEAPFVDDRGVIQSLLERNVRSVAIIDTKKGAIRANHWHKTDWHYCYVVSGEIIYSERPLGSQDAPVRTTIRGGQLFFSPPNVEHAMYFPVDTVFLTFSRNPRDHETYEDDVQRVELVKVEDFEGPR